MNLTRLVRSSVSLPFRAIDTGVRAATVAATVGVGLVTDPTRIATATPNDFVNAVTDVAAEIFGRTPSRRRWQGDRRCWIEVRGLDDSEPGDALPQAVLRHVRDQPGVLRVDLNHALSRVVVHTDGMESLDELSDAVAAAERDADVDTTQPSIDLPGDGIVLASSITALTANTLGLATALVGRALMWPKLVPGLSAAVTFVDYQPRLRGLVEEWLGEDATDTALALAASIGYTLGQAPTSLAVDVFMHLVRVAEAQSAALAWQRHEPTLAEHAESMDGIRPNERPQPLPSGPVERHGDRSSVIQGVGAIVLGIATGGVSGAATTALVAAPKAARNTREAFAGTLARGLADRHDVVPLRSNALRRLDRIDAVVIDPRVLWTSDLRVGRIRDVDDRRRAEVWQWAQDQIDADALTAGWHDEPDGAAGRVLVRYATHALASSVLREIRRSAIEVVSVDVDGLDDLRSSFDDLHPFPAGSGGRLDDALAASVRRLQDDGRTVALVSSAAAQALADADLSIGVAIDAACWHADVIADDLDGVWRVLHAIPAARRASERGVQLATGASVLGALLMVPGVRGRGPGPVTAGAGAGAWTGYRIARQVLGDPTPAPPPTLEWHAMSIEQVRRKLPRSERLAAPAPQSRINATASTVTGLARAVGSPVKNNVTDFATAMKDELSDPLTPVLAIGSAASAILGSPVDAILVGSVLTGNAALAAVQRLRAERLLNRLLAVQDPPARLLTEDGEETVDAVDLRPGDVIEVRPGEVVPADVRLTEATDLEVDESSLTGESLPVPKRLAATPAAPVAERSSMLHATTTVVAGTGVGIVTAVGSQTQARRAEQAPGSQNSSVGLQAQLRDLTNRALPVSLAGGALVTGLGILRGAGLRQAVSSGVAVSVAAVPEGLPLVATLAQQASARRLSALGALVRSPRSVEALGRVDVVCFDKTGTLSENRLRVTSVAALDGTDEDVLRHAVRATPPANGDGHEHATDAAVAEAGDPDANGTADAFLPFRSGRPFAAAIHGTELSIKGAPEVLLAACGEDAAADRVQQMAADGLRVLAVARRDLTKAQAREAAADADAFDALCREEAPARRTARTVGYAPARRRPGACRPRRAGHRRPADHRRPPGHRYRDRERTRPSRRRGSGDQRRRLGGAVTARPGAGRSRADRVRQDVARAQGADRRDPRTARPGVRHGRRRGQRRRGHPRGDRRHRRGVEGQRPGAHRGRRDAARRAHRVAARRARGGQAALAARAGGGVGVARRQRRRGGLRGARHCADRPRPAEHATAAAGQHAHRRAAGCSVGGEPADRTGSRRGQRPRRGRAVAHGRGPGRDDGGSGVGGLGDGQRHGTPAAGVDRRAGRAGRHAAGSDAHRLAQPVGRRHRGRLTAHTGRADQHAGGEPTAGQHAARACGLGAGADHRGWGDRHRRDCAARAWPCERGSALAVDLQHAEPPEHGVQLAQRNGQHAGDDVGQRIRARGCHVRHGRRVGRPPVEYAMTRS